MKDSHGQLGRDSRTQFARTFLPVTQANHSPGVIYNDPNVLEREKEVIFRRDWLCVGRAEEVANPGDYKALRIIDEPILICRTLSGKIAAYSNTCQHRGVEVAYGSGNTKRFSCPYHNWTYDLEGKLVGAPHMLDAESFDRSNCRLPVLPCESFQGWIFVSLSKAPEKFETHIAAFAEKFGYLDMEPMRLGVSRAVELKCNWKLMVENFIDFYHSKALHKNTLGRFMTTVDVSYDLRARGEVFVDEYDAGTHSEDGKVFVEPIAALKDKPPRFSQAAIISPNINFFVRPDYVFLYTAWPLSEKTMLLHQYVVFPRHVVEAPTFSKVQSAFLENSNKVLGEDISMVESLQNASKAMHFAPGRMSRIEKGVQHYILHNINRIYGDEFDVAAERPKWRSGRQA